MPILDKLIPASFRGVPFLVGNVSTESGRKQITHEYPNTDRRVVEDLGRLHSRYSVNGWVITKDDFTARDRLRDALNQPGYGELVHPYYGTKTVAALVHTVTENANEVGLARFTMTFEEVQDPIYPTESSVKPALIKNQSDIVLDSILTDFTETFEVSKGSAINYADALSQMRGLGSKFTTIGQSTSAISGNLNSYTAAVLSFNNGLTQNIFNPASLGNSIGSILLEMDTIAPTALEQFNISSSLFGFGEGEPDILQTTIPRIQRATNRLIVNTTVRTSALSLAYNNAADIVFDNERQLNTIRQRLETEYQGVVANTNLTDNTLSSLQDLRNTSRQFFDDAAITVPKIFPTFVSEAPMTIQAFNYYGDVAKTEQLIALNDAKDVSFVSRAIEILTP